MTLVGITSYTTTASGMVGYLSRLIPLGDMTIIILSVRILVGITFFWG